MRRTKLAILAETNPEEFRKELLRYHRVQSVYEWENSRGCLRKYTFIVKDKEYRFTMLNGEVIGTHWSIIE